MYLRAADASMPRLPVTLAGGRFTASFDRAIGDARPSSLAGRILRRRLYCRASGEMLADARYRASHANSGRPLDASMRHDGLDGSPGRVLSAIPQPLMVTPLILIKSNARRQAYTARAIRHTGQASHFRQFAGTGIAAILAPFQRAHRLLRKRLSPKPHDLLRPRR